LRGHGQSGGVTGDIDYIGQYEDDISDVVTQIRSAMPSSRIILAGHSMGGGILQRYAMKSSSPPIDGYLLFAPLLGNGSPTIRGAMEQSVPVDAPVYMQIHLVRILGLVMLNSIGITQLNSLPTMLINPSLDLKVSNYSYRAMASTAPQEFVAGLSAINAPLLVIVGSNDEAFVASAFQPLVDSYTRGQLVVIEGETHNGITHNLQALDAVRQWLEEVPSGNGESAKDQK
jgi:alpha-beta hydrolase superfamily lysophospholipase